MDDADVLAALLRLEDASRGLRDRLRDRIGLTGADLSLLRFVHRAGVAGRQVRVKDLALHLGLTGPAVTGIIDRLGRQGFLQRVPNPDDGRSRFIELTEEQQAVFTSTLERTNEQLHELLSSFTDRERRRLVRIADRIAEALGHGASTSS